MEGFKVGVPISLQVGHITAEEVARRIYGEDQDKADEFVEKIKDKSPMEMKELLRISRMLEFGRTYGFSRSISEKLGVEVSEDIKKRIDNNTLIQGGNSSED